MLRAMPKHLRIVLAALAAVPLLAQAPSPEAFRIINGTGAEAVALHAVRSGRADWGSNLLSRGPLAANGRFALRPSANAGCQFDLRLVLEDGREAVLREQDICANREVRLATVVAVQPRLDASPRTGTPPPPSSGGGPQPNANARVASGTGFVVARDVVLTNQHVVDGCNRILVRTSDGRTLAATPPARIDQRRDLALLAVPGNPGPPLTFRTNEVRRGEPVVTYGFPLSGLLSSGPTLTTGEVSALAGMQDNPVQFQISAPVQPGNSGGPLFDRQGHVVGVVVSKLNAQRVAARTGDIPQNVNFAVKGSEAMEFMRRAGITPLTAESRGTDRNVTEVGESAHPSTLFIRCER